MEIVIGDGLEMNCSFQVENCINSQETPQDYRIIMKMFLRQLFDAKESQIEEQRKKWEKLREKEEENQRVEEKKEPTYVKDIL